MDKWLDEYVRDVMDQQLVTNGIFKRWWKFWGN